MKEMLNVGFVGFAWGPWPDPVAYFTDILKDGYDVCVTESDFPGCLFDTHKKPDLLICTIPGVGRIKHKCPIVHFPVELYHPDFDKDVWWMTYDHTDHSRHYRLPGYALYGDMNRLTEPKPDFESLWDRKFCCVLFGKAYPRNVTPREDFFHKLCEYKKVDSAGHHLNNTGARIPGANHSVEGAQGGPHKIDFLRDYKFVLAFENSISPGYVSEKIVDPMFANSVAIHWGNPVIGQDFNSKSFVNCHDYVNFEDVIDRIVGLDLDKDLYRSVIEQPYFTDNKVNEYVRRENILAFFKRVLNGSK